MAGPLRFGREIEIQLRFPTSRHFLALLALAGAQPIAFQAEATMPTTSGGVPSAVAEAFERGLFALPARGSGLGVSAAPQAVWRIPIILAAFDNEPLTYSAADFDSALFGTRQAIPTGSFREYYEWASGGRLTVTGRVVATVRLPGTLAYYGDGQWGLSGRPQSSVYGAVKDALRACQAGVDWSEFDVKRDGTVDMLWLVHAGKGGEASLNELPAKHRLWSITSALNKDPAPGANVFETSQLVLGSTTERYKINRFSSLPEISGLIPGNRSEIGVYCHEFGHALDLPDLYDTTERGAPVNVGPGGWSLMSMGAYGGNGLQPESPSHLGGWASLRLGWSESIRPARDTTLRLAPISRGGSVVEFWFQGESHPEHFLLENRAREGFDRSLWEPGLIITHVDEDLIEQRIPGNRVNTGTMPALVLVEADGDGDLAQGRNHGDRFDPFPGDSFRTRFDDETRASTRTFGGAVTNIALSEIVQVGDEIQVNARVRSRGWLPAEDHTEPLFQPLASTSSGNLAVLNPDGSLDAVSSEIRAGRPQVVLRRRTDSGWSNGMELSSSPAAALTPAITLLPGGNAAVVWSDLRGGRSRIWVRVRLQGEWGSERVLADLPGENRAPAIGADGHGRAYVTWLNTQGGVARVYFMRFVYFAPFGQPIPLTPLTVPPRLPGNPAIAVDEDGVSYIIWPDAADNPQRLWFARFHPDSGIAVSQTLTATAGAETQVSALVDTAGTMHIVWHVNGTEASEIHYQRRFQTRRPAPRDTVLVSSRVGVGNPRLAMEPSGSLHLVYESTVGNAQQVFYKLSRPVWGWDFQGTEVSSTEDGSAGAPLVLPVSAGNVSVLFTGYGDAGARLMERRRELDVAPPPPAVALASSAPAALSLRPNPLRAGQEFELDWGGAPPGPGSTAELFDLAGRRISVAAVEPRGAGWHARFAPEVTSRLSSGVYFVRARAAGARAHRLVVLR